MSWIAPEREFVSDRVESVPEREEDLRDADFIETKVLVERSADLLQLDPGGRLRIACAEAIDRHGIGDELQLLSFGWDWIEYRELAYGAQLAPVLASSMDGLTEHVQVDLERTLRSLPGWMDGPEFTVVLCSSHAALDEYVLEPPHRHGDAHWHPGPPPTDSDDPPREPCDRCWRFWPIEHEERIIGSDACFVIAAIGAEPSPALRRLAELSGGVVVAVRDETEAEAFGKACRERYDAVLDTLARRLAEHDQWCEEHREQLDRATALAEIEKGLRVLDPDSGPATNEVAAETEASLDSGRDEELRASIEAALAACSAPVPKDFVKTQVFLERSSAALAADPAGITRVACADALDRRGIDHAIGLCAYGWGLISDAGLTYADTLPGPAREALRQFSDHTRVDLPKAFREAPVLSGANLLVVVGSELAEVPERLDLGLESEWEVTEDRFGGRYGNVVVLGVLGVEPTAAVLARCEATGGTAMAIRGRDDVERFANACADVHRQLLDVVETDCASGLLDLNEIYGY